MIAFMEQFDRIKKNEGGCHDNWRRIFALFYY